MPELRHLRCFVAAAEERNFTRAAARLHIVQQSLSAAIKQLEWELGVRLFDRTTRVVRLTAAGEELLPAARRVLDEADRAWAAVAAHRDTANDLEVGFSFTLDEHTRWRLLERFITEQSIGKLGIHTALTGELLDRVEARQLDFAVVFSPLPRAGIDLITVMDVPVRVLMGEDHRLASQAELQLTDLRDELFAVAAEPEGAGFNAWLVETCRRAGFVPRTVVSPPVAMSIPTSEVAPGAVTLAPWSPQWGHAGNVLRPLRPEVTVPYAAAVPVGTEGFTRRAVDAVVAAGAGVAAFLRKRDPALERHRN